MKIIFDNGADDKTQMLVNHVVVVIPISKTRERHVKVTHEGVFQELVELRTGEVLLDACELHEDMLGDIFEYMDDPPPPSSGRCKHGMFRSGAGACPQCGGGAE